MRWGRVLTAIATPMPTILYAVAWFSLQPALLRVTYVLPYIIGSNVPENIAQVISATVYVIANIFWLISWYKLTKWLRNRVARGVGARRS